MLGGIAGALAVFALLGYVTGIDTLYGSASASSPALPTFVGLLCVASAIVLRIGTMPVLRKPRPLWQLLVMLGCAIVAPLLLFGAYGGYAYEYNPLFDPDRNEHEQPHVIGRAPFGRITIANSDSGAGAYADCAIEQAHRAVEEVIAITD